MQADVPAIRVCLKCGEQFRSNTVGNRICRQCTKENNKVVNLAEPTKQRSNRRPRPNSY